MGKNVLDLAFLLLSEERGVTVCNIHLTFPKGKDARDQSFFHERCTNSDWYVSWGYNDDNDSAVMTVIKYVVTSIPPTPNHVSLWRICQYSTLFFTVGSIRKL